MLSKKWSARPLLVSMALACLSGLAGGGCVTSSTYDALRQDYMALQRRVADSETQNTRSQDNMRQQLGASQASYAQVISERDRLQYQLDDMRNRLQQVMPTLQALLNLAGPVPPQSPNPAAPVSYQPPVYQPPYR